MAIFYDRGGIQAWQGNQPITTTQILTFTPEGTGDALNYIGEETGKDAPWINVIKATSVFHSGTLHNVSVHVSGGATANIFELSLSMDRDETTGAPKVIRPFGITDSGTVDYTIRAPGSGRTDGLVATTTALLNYDVRNGTPGLWFRVRPQTAAGTDGDVKFGIVQVHMLMTIYTGPTKEVLPNPG